MPVKDIVDNALRALGVSGSTTDMDTGKQTQWYPDNYRNSLVPGKGRHWTNQNKARGEGGRHDAPDDSYDKYRDAW